MLEAVLNAFKIPDLRRKLLFTLGMLVIFRIFASIPVPGGVNRLLKRGLDDGVRVEVKDQAVSVDLYLLLEPDQKVREVARAVQAAVNRALNEMVGMTVLAVNVHVEDIVYPSAQAP